ncbi:MAG: hypothetical protein KA419_15355 [Acidobacteria bacterium]|nr:hypothetical protein [Acidobacteriota bacterium]
MVEMDGNERKRQEAILAAERMLQSNPKLFGVNVCEGVCMSVREASEAEEPLQRLSAVMGERTAEQQRFHRVFLAWRELAAGGVSALCRRLDGAERATLREDAGRIGAQGLADSLDAVSGWLRDRCGGEPSDDALADATATEAFAGFTRGMDARRAELAGQLADRLLAFVRDNLDRLG